MACTILSVLVSLYIQKSAMISTLMDCRLWKGTNNLGLEKKLNVLVLKRKHDGVSLLLREIKQIDIMLKLLKSSLDSWSGF